MSIDRRLRGLWLTVVILALTACSRPPDRPPVVLAAEQATATPTSTPSSTAVSLLPTWTPAATAWAQLYPAANAVRPLSPTRTPTVTPVFPTLTPIPPTRTPTPTLEPPATATRYVSLIPILPPTDELGPSKLGLHVVRNNDAGIMEFVRRAQPAVMKAVDDLGFLAEVKSVSPNTITIGRLTVGNQDYVGNPEAAARRFVADHLQTYFLNPAVDYWEGWNEPDPNVENMDWYSRFEQERVREMARHDLRTAIGGFATGVPEYHEFELFLGAVEVAQEYRGILTLHEYGAPDMTYLYGGALPGLPSYPDRGALTFRYRWFYRDLLEPAGLVIPLVVSEAGIDGIIGNRPGPAGLGWMDFQSFWVEQGWGADGAQAFINQLAWYDAGVRQDGYVIGFTVFTAGAFDQWEHYNVNSILPQLTGYVVGQR
ncbi:MAG: hypothetical protein AB1791_04640 [Chloroflexota bacterium]